jgi:hypothetical protein
MGARLPLGPPIPLQVDAPKRPRLVFLTFPDELMPLLVGLMKLPFEVMDTNLEHFGTRLLTV